jgi:hypothetical protein
MVDFLAKNVIRIVGGVIIIGAITLLPSTMVPVASKHKDPSTCTVSMGSVINGQQRLLVTAWALTPDFAYTEGQVGVQSALVTTDSTGAVSDQSLWFQGPGAYTIVFDSYYWSNNKLVQATATSCSADL